MNLRMVSTAIALVLSAMLLGTGVYQNVVDAPNYKGAPTSLELVRRFYHATNPGMFFRSLGPATQVFLLLALVFNWKPVPATRWNLVGALSCLIATDIITFRFHYPRNDILFAAPLTQPPAYHDRVVTEWAIGNYVRVALTLAAVVLLMVSTIRIARDTAPGQQRQSNTSRALTLRCTVFAWDFHRCLDWRPPSGARPRDAAIDRVPDSAFESSVTVALLEEATFTGETGA